MHLDRIQCVLVLYRITLQESESFKTLSRALLEYPSFATRISLLVYDNSPEVLPHNLSSGPFAEIRFQHDPSNSGLAAAYNEGLRIAQESGATWIWLFDQDTTVLPQLIPTTFTAIDTDLPSDICAIVPRLKQDQILLSPIRTERFRNVLMDANVSGITIGKVAALNSCSCLRMESLLAIGGFPPQYWLDFLDHAIFHRLQEHGGRVFVLDITIPHRLSTNNLRKESSLGRFQNLLAAEWLFVRETGWGGGVTLHRIRLLKRAVRILVTLREPAFALLVFKSSLC